MGFGRIHVSSSFCVSSVSNNRRLFCSEDCARLFEVRGHLAVQLDGRISINWSPAIYGFGLRRKTRQRPRRVLLLAARDGRYGGDVAPVPFTRLFGTSGRPRGRVNRAASASKPARPTFSLEGDARCRTGKQERQRIPT
jgi:hypothetical protein